MTWIKSSRCGGGSCVEVAVARLVHVRDSAGQVAVFDRAAWAAFLRSVR